MGEEFRSTLSLFTLSWGGQMSEIMRPRVILLDAEPRRRHEIASYLSLYGFVTADTDNEDGLIQSLREDGFDLAILQMGQLGLDELTLLGRVREVSAARCIILTNNDDLVDRVVALELGADDYLSETTDRRELLARSKAVLRRAGSTRQQKSSQVTAVSIRGESGESYESPSSKLTFDRVQRRLLRNDGSKIALTTAEFNLLTSFADHTNVSLTRERLYELVYHRRWSAYDRTLDTLVAKLRRKIERDPQNPELIKTVHGTGYIFTGTDFD
jgi:two-component system torCAD operon response regulator TorR